MPRPEDPVPGPPLLGLLYEISPCVCANGAETPEASLAEHSLPDFLFSLTKLGAVGVIGLGFGDGRGDRPSVGCRARPPEELLPFEAASCVVLCAPRAPTGTSRRKVPWFKLFFAM